MDKKEALVEWAMQFLKNKDAVLGSIQNIDKNKEGCDFKVTYSDKEEYCLVVPFIEDFSDVYEKINKEKRVSIFFYNCAENLDLIIENWKKLVDFDKLTLYFVNINANGETKWVLRPYLHNKISDDKSLKLGLKTMFSMVEPVL